MSFGKTINNQRCFPTLQNKYNKLEDSPASCHPSEAEEVAQTSDTELHGIVGAEFKLIQTNCTSFWIARLERVSESETIIPFLLVVFVRLPGSRGPKGIQYVLGCCNSFRGWVIESSSKPDARNHRHRLAVLSPLKTKHTVTYTYTNTHTCWWAWQWWLAPIQSRAGCGWLGAWRRWRSTEESDTWRKPKPATTQTGRDLGKRKWGFNFSRFIFFLMFLHYIDARADLQHMWKLSLYLFNKRVQPAAG